MHAIRRRLAVDDGISMVEMLVAIFVMTVALFALLSGLVASAKSLTDQRFRSVATRVAVDHLESLRLLGYDGLNDLYEELEDEGLGTLEELDEFDAAVTADRRTYTLETRLAKFDADPDFDPALAPPPEPGDPIRPSVIEVTAEVTWSVHGTDNRSVTYSTSVGQRNIADELSWDDDSPRIMGVTTIPTEAMIGDDGQAAHDVDIVVILKNFEPFTQVEVAWSDGPSDPNDPPDHTIYLTSDASGTSAEGTIAADKITWTFEDGDDVGHIDMTVKAPPVGEGFVQRTHTLTVRPEPENPPALTSVGVDPCVIQVHSTDLVNTHDVTFSATVTGMDRIEEDGELVQHGSVRVQYQLSDGTFQEQALVEDEDNLGSWSLEVQTATVDFKVDMDHTFVFTARSGEDGGVGTETKGCIVQEAAA